MTNVDFENADGGVIDYEVANGLQNIGNQYNEDFMQDGDGMSFADGNDDDFYNVSDDAGFENAIGRNFRKNQKKRQARKDLKTKSKAELRSARGQSKITKADAKVGLADAQKLSAEASAKGTEADIAMAKALEGKGEVKTGMSKGAKIGIIAGVVLVLGVVGFIVYKKMKKGK